MNSLWDWDLPASSVDSSSPFVPTTDPNPAIVNLGKRPYFNSASPAPSKRPKLPSHSTCQVEGCGADLSDAKDYHRKHRVCADHAKAPLVVIAGVERRFCQQCSRFHEVSAFDDDKRSCRKRLSDHNARRRKPAPERILFDCASFSSPFYDDGQHMKLPYNQASFSPIGLSTTSTWESSLDFKLGHMKGSLKSAKGDNEGQLLSGTGLSNTLSTLRHGSGRMLPFRGSSVQVFSQGHESSVVTSNMNGAPSLRRVLSLLSTDSSISTEPSASLAHTNQNSAPQHVTPSASSGSHWLDAQPNPQRGLPLSFSLHSSNTNQFQDFQLFRGSYESAFFDSSRNC